MIQHSALANEWVSVEQLAGQHHKIKIIEKISSENFNYSKYLNNTYSINPEKLLEILKPYGEIIYSEDYMYVIAPDYIIVPKIVNCEESYVKSINTPSYLSIVNSKNKMDFNDVSRNDSKYGIKLLIYSTSDKFNKIKSLIESNLKTYKKSVTGVSIDWAMRGTDLTFLSVQNTLTEIIHDEAYPYLNKSINTYINEYLTSLSPVLLIFGKPGMGKTRLVRYIIQTISEINNADASVLYTMDSEVFSDDKYYFKFLTTNYDAMIIEDMDLNLKGRTKGNDMMHKLLGSSDGFIRNTNKKIILTTNLTNIHDIDDALLRDGRCFDKIESRLLNVEESNKLLYKLNPNSSHIFTENSNLATIYDISLKK